MNYRSSRWIRGRLERAAHPLLSACDKRTHLGTSGNHRRRGRGGVRTGPAQGDLALKPEITAPGVGILAPQGLGKVRE